MSVRLRTLQFRIKGHAITITEKHDHRKAQTRSRIAEISDFLQFMKIQFLMIVDFRNRPLSAIHDLGPEYDFSLQFNQISEKEQHSERQEITKGLVKKAIKLMRNKRSADTQSWKAEWIKNGGDMFNRMEIKSTVPYQWNQLFIRSLHRKVSRRTLIIKKEFLIPDKYCLKGSRESQTVTK